MLGVNKILLENHLSYNTVDFFNTAAKSLRVTISISVSTITYVSHKAVTESDSFHKNVGSRTGR